MAATQELVETYVMAVTASSAGIADGDDNEEEPVTTDYTVTTLTVTEAGSYWLTGYDSINKVAGIAYPNARTIDATESTGEVIMVGNYKNNTIMAGEGKSSMWGGMEGNDILQGGSDRDMFWYGAGDGNDWVLDFTAGLEETADVLRLYSGPISSITRSGKEVTVKMTEGKGVIVRTVSTEVDSPILYIVGNEKTLAARIGDSSKNNTLSYAEDVFYYQGGSKKDTLVLSGGTDAKLVWLDGSKGHTYASIDVIDGSQSSGADQLAGTEASETIIGGRGAASLWGGTGSANDTLQAGTGDNLLYYGYGEGNDVMQDTHRNDKVMLYDITLAQLTSTVIDGEVVKLTTTAGQTLTINGKAGLFVLKDGSSWVPDRQSNTWSRV